MYVMVRPGPFVCAEWDFGGLPSRLLKDTSEHIRTTHNKYFVDSVATYIAGLSKMLLPHMHYNGGPVLMV